MISDRTSFDILYENALNKNPDVIQTTGIDPRKGIFTPASKLASEGKIDALFFLLEHGANVHESGMGAAIGKKNELALLLHRRYGAHINFIAKGAAIAGDNEFLSELIDKYEPNTNMIAEGAAIAGNQEFVDRLLNDRKLAFHTELAELASLAAKGAVIGGDSEYALDLFNKYRIKPEFLLDGAVIAGDIEFIEKLSREHSTDVSYLAKGASYIGNKEYCKKLVDDDKWHTDEHYRKSIINGLAQGCYETGNLPLLRECTGQYFKDVFTREDIILKMISCSGTAYYKKSTSESSFTTSFSLQLYFESNYTILESFIKQLNFELPIFVYHNISLLKNARQDRILSVVEKGMNNCNLLSQTRFALHQFSFINDHDFLNALRNRKNLSPHILNVIPDAIKIHQLRHKYHIDFDQAYEFLNNAQVRNLFLYAPFNMGDMPLNMALSLLKVFSPLPLDRFIDLYDKISLTLNKSFIKSDLEKYHSYNWIYHRDRAASVAKAAETTNTRDEMKTLIHYQMNLFKRIVKPVADSKKPKHEQPLTGTVEDDFYKVIEKNSIRLK